MTVQLSGSGAMDDIEVCRTLPEPEIWTRTFDGGGDDRGYGVAADSNNDVVIAGVTFNGANSDTLVRKYTSAGITVWTQTNDSGAMDAGHGIATDAGNNVIVNGYASTDGSTRKYDAAGNVLWTEITNRGTDDVGNGVTTDLAGSVIAVGSFDNGSDRDMWISKFRP